MDFIEQSINAALDNLKVASEISAIKTELAATLTRNKELSEKLELHQKLTDAIIFQALNGSRTEMHLAICEYRFAFDKDHLPDPDADIKE
jgi:hypothetical protein